METGGGKGRGKKKMEAEAGLMVILHDDLFNRLLM